MSSYRRALKRDRARLADERAREGKLPGAYRARVPLRKIRAGQRVRARAGELFTVVTDVDGTEVSLGHVRAGESGLLELTSADVAAAGRL